MRAFLWIKSDNRPRVGIGYLVNQVGTRYPALICSNLTENQLQKWSVIITTQYKYWMREIGMTLKILIWFILKIIAVDLKDW